MKVFWIAASVLPVLLTLVGCGHDDGIARVEGVITIDGQPLPNATVLFVNGQSRPSGAITDAVGRYQLNFRGKQNGAIPGVNKVQITTAQGPSETEGGEPIAAVPESVPEIYNAVSTLKFVVEAGTINTANFDLDSKVSSGRTTGRAASARYR